MTQSELAESLGTSQSAVARMEAGRQNFTTAQLQKISSLLNRQIISLHKSLDFRIKGGHKLSGEITSNTSKNGAMGLMCASLLNRASTTLHGIPRIEEVYRMISIFESIGVKIQWVDDNSLVITPPKELAIEEIDQKAAGRVRSSLMMMGPLSHRVGKYALPHSGGCQMGARTITAHRYALESLGTKIEVTETDYEIDGSSLRPADITLYESSDTATINTLLTAALIPGETIIRFAPPNYQVQDVCFFLEALGVKIEGIGTTTLKVSGIEEINKEVEHHNSEDPIESMMFIAAAVTTNSKLLIKRCPIDFLRLELLKLEKMNLDFTVSDVYKAKNSRTDLIDITIKPSELEALPDKIHSQPYPGINVDNLPFFVPIATQARGTTLIHDWMWENRAIYFTELNRLGADITLADPHRVFIRGKTALTASQVVCPPALRPAVIILIAMLQAEGESILRNVYSINRGYEDVARRLQSIGADIEVITGV